MTTLAELDEHRRDEAMRRWRVLRPCVEDNVPLTRAARQAGVPLRTAQRWLARYRAHGLIGLAPAARNDAGIRHVEPESVSLIQALALRRPAPSVAHVHRTAADIAKDRGWSIPSYTTTYAIIRAIDPGLKLLALEGTKRYREMYDLIYRREARRPNEIWQADHTQLDIWVIAPSGKPARPWLTVIEDDHSRVIAGYAVNLGAPSAIQTALVLRQAIWRKADPSWHVCGIPEAFYTDHGCDFTSGHIEQAATDLHIRLIFSELGRPQGRGKIERYFSTINQMCLPHLPGYAPRGSKDRAAQAQLTLPELDAAIGRFIVGEYNHMPHGETGQAPQARWDASGFLPQMPDSLEQLDLLLLTVARPRRVQRDGIHFLGVRYLDTTLAAYVGEPVTIRYDPRDVAEIRVFHRNKFLCRAISGEYAGQSITLKDIQAARSARRRALRAQLNDHIALLGQYLPEPTQRTLRSEKTAAAATPLVPTSSRKLLHTYFEDAS